MMKKSILEMARGAFMERADYEVERLVENILDENTNPTAKRKLTLTATFTSDSRRENYAVSFEVKTTLAPTTPVMTSLYFAGRDSEGIPQVVEMTPQVPGQVDIAGNEQELPPMLRIVGR